MSHRTPKRAATLPCEMWHSYSQLPTVRFLRHDVGRQSFSRVSVPFFGGKNWNVRRRGGVGDVSSVESRLESDRSSRQVEVQAGRMESARRTSV